MFKADKQANQGQTEPSIPKTKFSLSPPLAIFVLYYITRVVSILLSSNNTSLYPNSERVMGDITLYASWTDIILNGQIPTEDLWQYPPLAAIVPLFAYGEAYAPLYVGITMLVDLVAMFFLIIAASSEKRWLGAWVWAAAPLIAGPLWLTRYDMFVTVAAMLALLYLVRRPILAAILISIGFCAKLWPALILLALPKDRKKIWLWFTGTTLAILSTLYLIFGSSIGNFIPNMLNRGVHLESWVGAIFHLSGKAITPGEETPPFRFGAYEIYDVTSTPYATILVLCGIVWIGILAWRWNTQPLEKRVEPAVLVLAFILAFIVTNKVFSPQYIIWVIGLLAVATIVSKDKRIGYITLLIAVAGILGQLIYPIYYVELLQGQTLYIWLLLAKLLLFSVSAILATLLVWQGNKPAEIESNETNPELPHQDSNLD